MFPLFLDAVISEPCAEDIACQCAGRVAVAGMIYGSYQRFGKVILIFQRAVDGDSNGLLCYPTAAEVLDADQVRPAAFGITGSAMDAFFKICKIGIASKQNFREGKGFFDNMGQRSISFAAKRGLVYNMPKRCGISWTLKFLWIRMPTSGCAAGLSGM